MLVRLVDLRKRVVCDRLDDQYMGLDVDRRRYHPCGHRDVR